MRGDGQLRPVVGHEAAVDRDLAELRRPARAVADDDRHRSGRKVDALSTTQRRHGVYGLLKCDPLGMLAHPPRQTGRCRVSAQMSTKAGAFQFLHRKGRYATGWVPIGEGTSDVFVRYDQIIEVRKNLSP